MEPTPIVKPTNVPGALITPPLSPRRDEEFYSQDIVFLVEDVLFKVPRLPFENYSAAFSDAFALPPPDNGADAEGSSDDSPIALKGVTKDEFKALLSVMFRSAYGRRRTLTTEQWTAALKLSSMWVFDDIRDQAIAELSHIVPQPAARIALAREFNIRDWIEPALIALVKKDALSVADLEPLGWATAAKLIQIRESIVFTGCACVCNYCTHGHGPTAQQAVGHQVGTWPAAVSAASLRRSLDCTQKIRELFGTELL